MSIPFPMLFALKRTQLCDWRSNSFTKRSQSSTLATTPKKLSLVIFCPKLCQTLKYLDAFCYIKIRIIETCQFFVVFFFAFSFAFFFIWLCFFFLASFKHYLNSDTVNKALIILKRDMKNILKISEDALDNRNPFKIFRNTYITHTHIHTHTHTHTHTHIYIYIYIYIYKGK